MTFGPTGANWFSYTAGSDLFRVGHPGSAGFTVDGSFAAINRTTSVARSGSSAYSLIVPAVDSAVNNVQVRGSTSGQRPDIRATGSDSRIPLLISGKGAGFAVDTSVMAFATGNASAASAGVTVGEVYINTAIGGCLCVRTA
jgi:hypothetical protein